MNLFRLVVLTLLLSVAAPALANGGSGDPRYTIQNPPAYAMLGDLLIARPLLLAATVIGTGAFVVSLPFTALGGGVGDAGNEVVNFFRTPQSVFFRLLAAHTDWAASSPRMNGFAFRYRTARCSP